MFRGWGIEPINLPGEEKGEMREWPPAVICRGAVTSISYPYLYGQGSFHKNFGGKVRVGGLHFIWSFFPKIVYLYNSDAFCCGRGQFKLEPPAQGQRVQIQPEIGISEVSQPRQGFR